MEVGGRKKGEAVEGMTRRMPIDRPIILALAAWRAFVVRAAGPTRGERGGRGEGMRGRASERWRGGRERCRLCLSAVVRARRRCNLRWLSQSFLLITRRKKIGAKSGGRGRAEKKMGRGRFKGGGKIIFRSATAFGRRGGRVDPGGRAGTWGREEIGTI